MNQDTKVLSTRIWDEKLEIKLTPTQAISSIDLYRLAIEMLQRQIQEAEKPYDPEADIIKNIPYAP